MIIFFFASPLFVLIIAHCPCQPLPIVLPTSIELVLHSTQLLTVLLPCTKCLFFLLPILNCSSNVINVPTTGYCQNIAQIAKVGLPSQNSISATHIHSHPNQPTHQPSQDQSTNTNHSDNAKSVMQSNNLAKNLKGSWGAISRPKGKSRFNPLHSNNHMPISHLPLFLPSPLQRQFLFLFLFPPLRLRLLCFLKFETFPIG
jgi:hypothetical protein